MENSSFTQMRIMETANSFRRLYYIYRDKQDESVIGEQMLETANVLEEILGLDKESEELDKYKLAQIKKVLRHNGITLDKIRIYRKRNGRLWLMVMARTSRGQCVHVEDMAKFLGEYFEIPLVPSEGTRTYISGRGGEVMLEESPEFFTMTGVCAVGKGKNRISGDSYSCINNQGGKSLVCICDGMGTGLDASRTSTAVVEMLEQFFEIGFSEATGVRLVNWAMAARSEDNPFTLDLAVFDLYEGKYSMLKFGAMASYIKRGNQVWTIRPSSLPAGVFENAVPDIAEYDAMDGDYVIMVSDGVMDVLPFFDKEQQMANIIERLPRCNPKLMAEIIMEEVSFFMGEEFRDDMTVVVSGVWKHHKR